MPEFVCRVLECRDIRTEYKLSRKKQKHQIEIGILGEKKPAAAGDSNPGYGLGAHVITAGLQPAPEPDLLMLHDAVFAVFPLRLQLKVSRFLLNEL